MKTRVANETLADALDQRTVVGAAQGGVRSVS